MASFTRTEVTTSGAQQSVQMGQISICGLSTHETVPAVTCSFRSLNMSNPVDQQNLWNNENGSFIGGPIIYPNDWAMVLDLFNRHG